MNTELAVCGRPHREELDDKDRAFLSECDVDLPHRPWR
jgi:hypothetical protein